MLSWTILTKSADACPLETVPAAEVGGDGLGNVRLETEPGKAGCKCWWRHPVALDELPDHGVEGR